MRMIAAVIAGAGLVLASTAWPAEPALVLEAKIPLGDVSGRIDHLSVDLGRQRLFVAELGNNSVGVIDLKAGKLLRTISGLAEPQGVGYVASTDTLYVANAGDGSVRLFQGENLVAGGRIELGDDADNIRVDRNTNRLYVGYGSGALAVIDPSTRKRIGDIALKAHPEAFQLDPADGRIFVNVPDASHIAVADMASGKQIATWPARTARANFPMALDGEAKQVIVAFRRPAKLMAFAAGDGAIAASLDLCGDADDVFVDSRRHRLYASCGQGMVDVFERQAAGYARVARVPTLSGARTALFVPELDRLYVAVRATAREPAAIWVFRPAP